MENKKNLPCANPKTNTKIRLLEKTLKEEITVNQLFLDNLTPIGVGGKMIYKYCIHKNKNCFDTMGYKCNGYKEYEIDKST